MKSICVRFTKRTLLTILIVHLSFFGFAATYYVSNAGNDSNSGLSISMPWKTLGKVNASTFVPGDQILFKKGDTFYGSLTIGQSGTSSSRIVYGAYGTGANPIITGFTAVTSWTNLGSNIWESTSAVSTLSDLNMVVINGVNTGMGRTPNTGYYYYQAHTTGTISSNNLTGFNWTGAECAFNSVPYSVKRLKITGASGTALWLNGTTGIIWDNQQFIIQDDPRTLDIQNEWYYNPSTKKLRIYSISQPTNVQISTIETLVTISANYVTLDNILLIGSNYRAILIGGNNYITVQNCDIKYSGTSGIDGLFTTGSNILIDNCTVTDSNNGGIAFTRFFTYVTIRSTAITNGGMIYGATSKASMSNNAGNGYGISVQGANSMVELNTIENTGYVGITTFAATNQVIQKNLVKTFCIHQHDGGGIYTWNGTVANATQTGIEIKNNIVIGNTANGVSQDNDADACIYLDDYSNGIEVSGNTCVGADYGIFLHEAHDVIIQGNTTFNNDKGVRLYGKSSPFYMKNITVQNNIVVAKQSGQNVLHLDPMELILPTFVASNNIYARPINDTQTVGGYNRTPSFSSPFYTVSNWQTFTGKEANSTKSPQSITSESDMRYEYNETNTAKTVTLSQPMMDMRGVKYTGSITLQPYKSVVLIKDVTSASVPGAPTSIVATAGNANASVTFLAPLSNGGSTITGYTVTSIPAGGTDINAGSTSLTHTVTGLTNGTSYTFTVKATNSIGTSLASAASNSVIPGVPKDITAPVVSTFSIPTTATSPTVSISAFTATDNIGVTGYLLSETSTAPLTGATGWTSTKPTSYIFSTSGTKTLYAWVKDAAGNVSASLNSVVIITINQTVDPNAHFKTVWQGENGQNHMNIIVISALLENLQLSVDDEIAVFSGAACVGVKKLTKSINPADNSTFLTISASQDDGSNNGFKDNDTIIFKIWDSKNQKEMVINSVIYKNDLTTWITNGKYVPSATATVEIEAYANYYQTIELKKGYNLFSTFLMAQDPNASSVTKSLADQGNLIKMQDEAGNSLENWGSFGGWINNLGSMEQTKGYKIQVANNCTLQVAGRPVVLPLDIPLKTGWNIISFPHFNMVDAMNVIQPLIDQNKLVKVQDETGNSIENWGIFGGWKNGIGYFIPGKAYKVKMTSDAVLTMQENYLKSVLILADAEETEYFSTEVEGNGSEHMNINIVGLRDAGISAGDELAAFDGDICVGTIKITENHMNDGSVALVSSFSSDNQTSDGFTEGHGIQIAAWNKLTDEELNVKMDVLSGQISYAKSSSVLLKVKALTTDVKSFQDVVTIDVFPNPSQGMVTVRFSTIPEVGSSIEIVDISGRKVASRLITGMSEVFQLGSQAPGIYLVKTVLGSKESINKLVLN